MGEAGTVLCYSSVLDNRLHGGITRLCTSQWDYIIIVIILIILKLYSCNLSCRKKRGFFKNNIRGICEHSRRDERRCEEALKASMRDRERDGDSKNTSKHEWVISDKRRLLWTMRRWIDPRKDGVLVRSSHIPKLY